MKLNKISIKKILQIKIKTKINLKSLRNITNVFVVNKKKKILKDTI